MTALPAHHRDAFDRLLVAQAQQLGLAILSADPALGRYDIEVWSPERARQARIAVRARRTRSFLPRPARGEQPHTIRRSR